LANLDNELQNEGSLARLLHTFWLYVHVRLVFAALPCRHLASTQ
jgi:hypothetical protein